MAQLESNVLVELSLSLGHPTGQGGAVSASGPVGRAGPPRAPASPPGAGWSHWGPCAPWGQLLTHDWTRHSLGEREKKVRIVKRFAIVAHSVKGEMSEISKLKKFTLTIKCISVMKKLGTLALSAPLRTDGCGECWATWGQL